MTSDRGKVEKACFLLLAAPQLPNCVCVEIMSFSFKALEGLNSPDDEDLDWLSTSINYVTSLNHNGRHAQTTRFYTFAHASTVPDLRARKRNATGVHSCALCLFAVGTPRVSSTSCVCNGTRACIDDGICKCDS